MATNPNDPAFGHTAVEMFQSAVQSGREPREIHYKGLTKREYLAAMAMQGILSSGKMTPDKIKLVGRSSIYFADALIRYLSK